jgi:hypothetical protein
MAHEGDDIPRSNCYFPWQTASLPEGTLFDLPNAARGVYADSKIRQMFTRFSNCYVTCCVSDIRIITGLVTVLSNSCHANPYGFHVCPYWGLTLVNNPV